MGNLPEAPPRDFYFSRCSHRIAVVRLRIPLKYATFRLCLSRSRRFDVDKQLREIKACHTQQGAGSTTTGFCQPPTDHCDRFEKPIRVCGVVVESHHI